MRTGPEVLDQPPLDRITEEAVRALVAECEERLNDRSIANQVSDLLAIATAAAPERDWSWLRLGTNRLLSKANSNSLPPPVPLTAGEVFGWSLRRMKAVDEADYSNAKKQAIHFRQALMIGLLIARPIRRRTFLLIEVGKHLLPDGDSYKLSFSADDIKYKRARDYRIPQKLVEPMQQYLERYRRILLQGKTSAALWISQYGDQITPDGFSREFPKVTERHLGVPLRSHAFRHVAATSIAETDPAHVNIIKDILGHATLDMSQRHYNRAQGVSAATELQSIVEDIQNSMPIVGRA